MSLADNAASAASAGTASTSLLRRVQTQEPDGWRRLVALYGPIVFLWCRRSGLSAHDAADVVQETFASVASHIADFRRVRPGDSFRGWLWTITRNKIRDYARRMRQVAQARGGTTAQQAMAQFPDDDASASSEPPQSPPGLLEHRGIEAIRAEFEDRTWQAFWQLTMEGRKAGDIARELGMNNRAVRQAKYRVLRRLRLELDGLLE